LSKYGILRHSDRKNKTLLEVVLDEEDLSTFFTRMKSIDFKNMALSDRITNHCRAPEYSFTFIDTNKIRYNYTSTDINRFLRFFKLDLEKLIKKYSER